MRHCHNAIMPEWQHGVSDGKLAWSCKKREKGSISEVCEGVCFEDADTSVLAARHFKARPSYSIVLSWLPKRRRRRERRVILSYGIKTAPTHSWPWLTSDHRQGRLWVNEQGSRLGRGRRVEGAQNDEMLNGEEALESDFVLPLALKPVFFKLYIPYLPTTDTWERYKDFYGRSFSLSAASHQLWEKDIVFCDPRVQTP